MTDRQLSYIHAMREKLGMTVPMLNWWIREVGFRGQANDVDELTVRGASELIENMKSWPDVPVDVRRAFGQTTLPGVEL